MTSLVSEFLFQPVLRQARRFSGVSFSFSEPPPSPPASPSNSVTPSTPTSAAPANIAETLASTTDDSPIETAVASTDILSHQNPPDNASTCAFATSPASPTSGLSTSATSPHSVRETDDNVAMDPAPNTPNTPTESLTFPLDLDLDSPRRRRRNSVIPEDDGMSDMRNRIQTIHARDVPSSEKARLMHDLLLEGYNASRAAKLTTTQSSGQFAPDSSSSPLASAPAPYDNNHEHPTPPQGPLESLKFWQNQFAESPVPEFHLSESDKAPSYAPLKKHGTKSSGFNTPRVSDLALTSLSEAQSSLGCRHYQRNVKLQCFTCNKWYPCRLCHDAQEHHKLPRFETRHMLCMLCTTPQRVSDLCIKCGEAAAQYYCSVCKLWEDRSSKPIYHCYDCGICRRGFGLGKDYIHCKTCCVCIPASMETSHKCIERSTDCDCPICGEYLFTSPRPVVFMSCGHSIHKKCYDQHMRVSYKCPICNKSLANMETQFRNLDVAIQSQPMPPEFRDTKVMVLCNDCSGRCTVPYHWLGQKCSICRSYNTVELRILGRTTALEGQTNIDGSGDGHVQTPTQLVPVSRTETEPVALPMARRRRHSSHGAAVHRHTSELVAGSFPPVNVRLETILGQVTSDSDSDDGMLGSFWPEEGTSFWGGGPDRSGLSGFWGEVEERASLALLWNGIEERANGLSGFWGIGGDESEEDDGDEEEEEESDGELDDEEDENEIVLFGHR